MFLSNWILWLDETLQLRPEANFPSYANAPKKVASYNNKSDDLHQHWWSIHLVFQSYVCLSRNLDDIFRLHFSFLLPRLDRVYRSAAVEACRVAERLLQQRNPVLFPRGPTNGAANDILSRPNHRWSRDNPRRRKRAFSCCWAASPHKIYAFQKRKGSHLHDVTSSSWGNSWQSRT